MRAIKSLFSIFLLNCFLINGFSEDNPFLNFSNEDLATQVYRLNEEYKDINGKLSKIELYNTVSKECSDKVSVTGARGTLVSLALGLLTVATTKNGYIGATTGGAGMVFTFYYATKKENDCMKNGLKENDYALSLFKNKLVVLNMLKFASDEVGRRRSKENYSLYKK